MKNAIAIVGVVILVASCGDNNAGNAGSPNPAANPGASCTAAAAALGNSCAAGLAQIFECWMPSGDCTVQGFGVNFENGSRFEATDAIGLEGRYLGPSGQVCGSFETGNVDPSMGDVTVDFTNADGQMFTIESMVTVTGSAADQGDITIRCPGGDSIVLTAQDQEELQACSAPLDLCANTAGPVDPGDFEGIGESCNTTSDCPSIQGINVVCCDLFGETQCQEQTACEILMDDDFGSCTTNADCPNIGGLEWICCGALGDPFCTPAQGCVAF
ncbi:MAG: hypothetical protein AAF500_07435 [Myxococcota bacterium]